MPAENIIRGGAGSASYSGNTGFDVLDYSNLGTPITVTLGLNNVATVAKGALGTDSLTGFERIIGTGGADIFNGSSSSSYTNMVYMVGGAGNDTFNGFSNWWNVLDYSLSPGFVSVDLALGIANDGMGGTDILNNIVYVYASNFNDTIKGAGNNEKFNTGGGNDLIDGGSGFDSLDYAKFRTSDYTITAVFTGNTSGSVVKAGPIGFTGTDSFTNIERIRGTGGNDILTGTTLTSGTTITLEGDAGNDVLNGQNSLRNIISYSSSPGNVTVDLQAGTAQDGWGGTDTLINVIRVQGGVGNDNIAGAATNDWFGTSNGNDIFNGRGGMDTLDYNGQIGPITVNFTTTGTGTVAKNFNGVPGTDNFSSIEVLHGSNGDDTITGFSGANVTTWLRGMTGNDTIDGANNINNVADYSGITSGVTIDMAAGTATSSGQGTDTLKNVLAVRGSITNDVFRSGAGNFSFDGGGAGTSPGNNSGSGDAMDYRAFTTAITLTGVTNLGGTTPYFAGTVTKTNGTDTFTGFRGVHAGSGNDSLTGAAETNGANTFFMRGEQGNDTLDGVAGGNNAADYIDSPTGVVVNLQTSKTGANWAGTAQDGWGGTDTLLGFTRLRGSDNGNDMLTGSDRNDFFWGTRGNDTMDGGAGFNTANYNNGAFQVGFSGTIAANFTGVAPGLYGYANATVAKTFNGATTNDTLLNINQVNGTPLDDVLQGLNGVAYSFSAISLQGYGGNDTIYGWRSTANRADYSGAGNAVSVDLQLSIDSQGRRVGSATDVGGSSIGTDTLFDVVAVNGSGFNDTLLGSDASDVFSFGNTGLHSVNGRGGANEVRFSGTNSVTIDLGTVATTDGFGGYQGFIQKAAGNDILANIANAQGGSGNDTVYGTPGNNTLSGGSGNNLIDGRDGTDTLSYRPYTGLPQPLHGAIIRLDLGTATNPWDGADTLVSIENAIGTQWDDDITGAILPGGALSYLRGDGGNDTLRAPMADTRVTADYRGALSGVIVNLQAGVTSDDGWFGGHDTLVNIQSVRGGGFADSLVGSNRDDTIEGAGGNDIIDGGSGTDIAVFSGTQAQSRIGMRDGHVIVSGPDGVDQLSNIELLTFVDSTAVAIASIQLAGQLDELVLTNVGGVSSYALPDIYAGPVAGVKYQWLGSAAGEVALGTSNNDFFNLLGGDDAVDAGAGNDIIDGGIGSNFLTGGAGLDTFFLDGRGGTSTWSTITDWQTGEQLSLFGWRPGVSQALWVDRAGAVGYQGVTMFGDLDANGTFDTSVTWSGRTRADLPTGHEFDGLLWFV